MLRKTILVDMDDTICHLVKRSIEFYNKDFPSAPIRYEDVVEWDLSRIWDPSVDTEEFFAKEGLFANLDLLDAYVVEEMEKINRKHELIIVTAAWPFSVYDKWQWLQKHMPFIEHDQYCTFKRKYKIDADLLIDDAAHNLLPWIGKGKAAIGIAHPWNLSIRDQLPFRENWKGMAAFIDEILDSKSF